MKSVDNNELSICAWNMRGFDISIPYLRVLLRQFNIVCISEHWLYNNQHCRFDGISSDTDFICRSSNLSTAENYGLGRGQGGVAIMWDKRMGE